VFGIRVVVCCVYLVTNHSWHCDRFDETLRHLLICRQV